MSVLDDLRGNLQNWSLGQDRQVNKKIITKKQRM